MIPSSALFAALLWSSASGRPLELPGEGRRRVPGPDPVHVRARVVGPRGEPIEGLGFWIAAEGPIGDPLVTRMLRDSRRETDAEGRLERWAARPGSYLLLPEPDCRRWPSWILEPARVSTWGEHVLEARFARVRVRAVDRLGDPVEDGDSFCVRVGGEVWSWSRPDVGESGTATLEPDAVLTHSAARPWRASEPHTWIARPGCSYVCGWFSPTRGLVERRVELAEDALEREVTFVLGDPAPPSSLEVLVDAGTGERPDPPLEVHVESPSCGAVIEGLPLERPEGDGRSLPFELPAGRYLVRVVPSPVPLPHSGVLPPESAGRCALVDLGLGEALHRDLPLARGSRLELTLRAPAAAVDPRVADLGAADPGLTEMATLSGWLPSELWGRVWVRESVEGPPRRLRFEHAGIVPPIAGVLPGSTATSFERLPPGRHALRVECAGFEPVEVELEAVDGEDARLTLDLLPSR